ncbi:amino acid adenylation domain-containing protein [Streptomyces sp. NPDC015492]|uniref:amino acid adenylation domain-containing protein n=1 Tax=Streptomyces sp. NPDC015492 TaxID=3364958 RepID=UPI0036F89DC7
MRGSGGTVLLDVLTGAAEAAPGQVIVHVGGDDTEHSVSHRALLDDALRVAGGLLDAGLAPGSPLLLPVERSEEFLPLFWGAVAAGLVPVPLAPDPRRVRPVAEFLGEPPLAVGRSTVRLLDDLPASSRRLFLDDLRACPAPPRLPERAPDDVAFLQFSSGSTGAPKGVELTHAAVLANLAQIRAAAGIRPTDVLATWMPYFHDMGLIGTHLVPLSARIRQVRLEPLTFAKRPLRWLEAASRHRATLLSAANFALALVERRVPADALRHLDLSCVRMMLVGAEPISPSVWRAFTGRMRPTGLPASAPTPVYGLAESTLAVTFPPPGEIARPLALDRAALGRGLAVDTAPGPDAVELMDVGGPVHGCSVRITDDAGHPVGERRVGHIEVRGPQLARGYHGAPEATAESFRGAWLRTGDLGFLREGRLCVTGRSKDVVFVDGRTLHAADLEEVAARTPGLDRCPVAVVGSTGPGGEGERVVVLLAPATPLPAVTPALLRAVRDRVRQALGHDDVRVLALPARALPRTTSGKVRRGLLRERFEGGEYPEIVERAALGVWGRGSFGAAAGTEESGAESVTSPTAAATVTGSPRAAARADSGSEAATVADSSAVVATVSDSGSEAATVADSSAVVATVSDSGSEAIPVCDPGSEAATRAESSSVTDSDAVAVPASGLGSKAATIADFGSAAAPLCASGSAAASTAESRSTADPVATYRSTADPVAPLVSAAPGVPASPAAPLSRPAVEAVVREVWARTLGLPDRAIGAHDDFRALGGSSLKAMEVLAGLEDAFGLELRPSAVREHTTVAALAGLVLAGGTSGGPGAAGAPPHDTTDAGSPSNGGSGGLPGPRRGSGQEAPHRAGRTVDPVIAVSALACRLPGADTPEAFWERLLEGYDAVTPVPVGRWAGAAEGPARRGAFLDEPDGFDAGFFGIGEEEARATDPQARILLELAHEALERAGYAGPRRLGRRVGVFVAAGDSGYRRILEEAHGPEGLPAAALTGNLPNMLAARVAHCLDLTGPALAVDTACSSALVALHLARRSLQAGECDVAVVGGVHLNLTPAGYALLEKAQALSPTGRCHAFGAAADGFVPGEGGAALVLTRLDEAERAGDPVLALLRGTAVNNDGSSLSLMAPNPLTQREVITEAYRGAGVAPEDVSYVEAHGTGTPIGDPVEVRSLAHAFPPLPDGRLRMLGSVKANIGHLLNAAGMPSLVKVVLALGQRRLPPSPLRTAPPAPSLDLAGAGFELVEAVRAWEAPGPLLAGVNAFGFGGTNAHAVLEEAPFRSRPEQRTPMGQRAAHGAAGGSADGSEGRSADGCAAARSAGAGPRQPRLLTLSAHGDEALRAVAADLAAHLRERPGLDEGDVCAAVAETRDEGPDRLALVADGDLAARLEAARLDSVRLDSARPDSARPDSVRDGRRPAGTPVRSRARLVLLLPGQGVRPWEQARVLHDEAPAFRAALEEASGHAGPIAGRSLAAWCLDDVSPDAAARTDVAQPLLVAYGVALARQVRAWGVVPDAVAGHSVGELAAACVAGTLPLPDAVRFAAERGRLMADSCPPGAMAAVRCDERAVADVVAAARGDLDIAAVNGPDQVVLAGTAAAVDHAVAVLSGRGVAARRLGVSRAFHSSLMDPALDALAEAARGLTPRRPQGTATPLISTVTADWQPVLDPAHLRAHARQPVRFGATVQRLLDDGYDTFVELGAATLGGSVRAVAAAHPRGSGALALAAGHRDGARGLLETVGRLWERGVPLDRTELDAGRTRIPVPTYPFQRRRYRPATAARPLLHLIEWDDAPATVVPGPRSVLLAGPESQLSRAFTDRLRARGVVVRHAGDPSADPAAVTTADTPPGEAVAPEVVVLLAGPGPEADPADGPDADALDAAHRALTTRLRALLPELAAHRPRVLLVTEDVHVTGAGAERPNPAQAVLTGLALALPEEYPGVLAHSVDLSSLDGTDARLDALDRELTAGPAVSDDSGGLRPAPAVAWRAGRRLGRTTRPAPPGAASDESALPPHGTYLITGGTGGVGAALARDLAGRGRPTLLLTGRAAEPPAGLLGELRALGGTVEYRAADVTRPADVDTLLAGLPRLDVLLHAAGVVRPGTLRAKTPDEIADALAAKTRGTALLARGLVKHDLRPGLCVAFSSVSAVLPGLAGAIGDYAAANAYLDAFAAAERSAGRPWQAVGFAAFAGTGLASAGTRGPRPLTTGEALAALHTAGGIDAAQLLVADLGRGATAPRPPHLTDAPVPPRSPRTATSGSMRRAAAVAVATQPSAPVPASALDTGPAAGPAPAGQAGGTGTGIVTGTGTGTGGVTPLLRQLLAEALHVSAEALGDDVPLLGLGLDSLMAVDLVKRLERELDRSLPITLFFEHRTLGELARALGDSAPLSPSPARPAAAPSPDDGALFSLTPVQLAFHTQGGLYPDVPAYGYVAQDIRGPLDPGLLGRALALLVDRHAMLRIRVLPGGSGPVQSAVPASRGHDGMPGWYEVRELPGERDAETECAELEEALRNRPFDLTSEGPLRAVLARGTRRNRAPGGRREVEEAIEAEWIAESRGTAGAAVIGEAREEFLRLVLVVHHVAADGFSLNVLGEELWTLYTALAQGAPPELPPLTTDFAAFHAHELSARSDSALAESRAYWRGVLGRQGEPLALPYDGDPLGLPEPPLLAHQVSPGPALSTALQETAAAHGVSLFHLLLAAYARCLSRWSGGREDVTVNVARARREARLPGIDRLVGPLADTLPVPVRVDPEDSVHALAVRLRDAWPESERHGLLTSLDLARLLPADGAGPRTAAPASFSFARFPVALDPRCPVEVRPTSAGTASAATRLGLLCWESDGELAFSWNFPARLFAPTTVARLAAEHLAELTEAAGLGGPPASASASVTGSASATSPAPLPAPAPIARAATATATTAVEAPATTAGPDLATPGDAPSGPPPPGDIVARLLARFRATPDAIAVDTDGVTLGYAELDRTSAALAARLRARGVVPGDLVGLLVEPGADAVTGVVGILRAGAGWVPLDAAHPPARLTDQLSRSRAGVLVCHAATRDAAAALAAEAGLALVAADDTAPVPMPCDADTEDASPSHDPDSLAYVIFTSGSTGRPKAVPITRRSLTNYLDWALDTFGYHAGDRLAQTASLCFDASVRQLLAPLLVGAAVVTLPRRLLRDPEALLDRVEQARISVWSSVPSLWSRLLEAAETRVREGGPAPDLSALRWIHVGGEALPPSHVRRWYDLFGPGHRIANLYGPTEATINATFHLIDTRPADDVRTLPIGTPLTGTDIDVVTPDGLRRCAPGEPGELLIAGVGLTPGYLHAPELTAAAFTVRDGRRWYRSGDRVRRGEDGVVEFLGRLDDQVKIRGHRVELGEVESVLLSHPAVARAAVVHRDERLAAFVQCLPGVPGPASTALRAHLARTLPEYMLPHRIHLADHLPLTGTGKIDRAALKPPAGDTDRLPMPSTGSLPATPTEVLLARVWSELLDTEAHALRREDDFFALGGDSLLVLQVFARLRETMPALPRPTVVYAHRTLAALAAAIDRGPADGPEGTAPVDAGTEPRAHGGPPRPSPPPVDSPAPSPSRPSFPTPFPLSPSQRGFLLAEAMAPGSPTAWLACLRVDGPLRPEVFQQAVDVCVARHPMLRTVFPAGMRPPVQQELPPGLRLPVAFETLAEPDLLAARIAEERARRFETWTWPLLRLRVLTLGPDEHALVVHAHHLIGDGYSVTLLGRELLAAYDRVLRGEPGELPPLRGTFRDHVRSLRDRAASTGDASGVVLVGRSERADRLARPYSRPVLGAQTAERSPAEGSAAVGPHRSTGFTLDTAVVSALRRCATGAGTTLFAPVLTAYYRTLADATGQADLILGLAVSGRDDTHPDAHLAFGPYAAAVPLRPGGGRDLRPGAGTGSPAGPGTGGPTFAEDLRAVVAEVEAARSQGVPPLGGGGGGLPSTAQFFFTFLDFSALGPMSGDTLRVRWDETDAELAPPPVGTDTFLAVRPVGEGRLRVTLRASATAFPDDTAFAAFAEALRGAMAACDAAPEDVRPFAHDAHPARGVLDSALVGYLPPPAQLSALAGGLRTGDGTEAAGGDPRAWLREALFPGGHPRLVEEIDTPLGRSGFVCLPLFADELASTPDLAARTARAVEHAASLGARSVSLAGMIPSLTAYGFGVLRETEGPTAVTTGHAATAVSVVKTVHAALARTGRTRAGTGGFDVAEGRDAAADPQGAVGAGSPGGVGSHGEHDDLSALGDLGDLGDLTVAVVGLGSIGSSSLELLLTLAPAPPARLILCDVEGSAARLRALAEDLTGRGLAGDVEVHESGASGLPAAVYAADLLVTAVSGGRAVLDVSRLRPGTIVVDDSFPHCFDTAEALARMRERRDVLIVGGGLLSVGAPGPVGADGSGEPGGRGGGAPDGRAAPGSPTGPSTAGPGEAVVRRTAPGLPPAVAAGYAARSWLPGTVASCRLESLLHAADPELPLVHGLVDARLARAYWRGMAAAGVTAGPLHLLGHAVAAEDDDLAGFPARRGGDPQRPAVRRDPS